MQFYSQVGQDRFIFETFFKGKRNGVFVDVGAYDGVKFSNSAFFEREMGWTGLCVEPLPTAFSKLVASRTALCEQVAVSNFEGEADFVDCDAGIDEKMLSGLAASFDPRHVKRVDRVATSSETFKVQVCKLSTLLEKHKLFHVDFCSIDTEGGELNILSELDFDRFHISVLAIENNYDDERITNLMVGRGYKFITKLEQDYIFAHPEAARLPRTSVICSVWHGDPKRTELLREHEANLARQTVPVEPIYVFDGGDEIPSWLKARAVSVREPLTIYQAWNVALSLVGTPLVMNLNLDDRLAPDAVETLENELFRHGAAAAGGDWSVRYTQSDTDNVEPCYTAERLPFVRPWPPSAGTITRLGSGTGERGTYGPAVLWRMDAHVMAPRYPWRLPDGSLIRSAADAAWWMVLQSHCKKQIIRVPMVIGNYYSHPTEQAEFRMPGDDELSLIGKHGISLL